MAEDLGLPVRVVTQISHKLQEAELVHPVNNDGDQRGLTLAKPPEDIMVTQLLELGQSMRSEGLRHADVPGGALLDRLATVRFEAVEGLTVAKLLK